MGAIKPPPALMAAIIVPHSATVTVSTRINRWQYTFGKITNVS